MQLRHSHILFACHEYQMLLKHCGPGLAQASTSTMPCLNTHMHVDQACTYTIGKDLATLRHSIKMKQPPNTVDSLCGPGKSSYMFVQAPAI